MTEREMGDQVASRQVSDSFGMLVGYSAHDAILFSKLNKRRRMLTNQTDERRREDDEREDGSRRAPLKPIYAFYYSS